MIEELDFDYKYNIFRRWSNMIYFHEMGSIDCIISKNMFRLYGGKSCAHLDMQQVKYVVVVDGSDIEEEWLGGKGHKRAKLVHYKWVQRCIDRGRSFEPEEDDLVYHAAPK